MQDTDKTTASAVELDETALDAVQGGAAIQQASAGMQKVSPAMVKQMPTAGGLPGRTDAGGVPGIIAVLIG